MTRPSTATWLRIAADAIELRDPLAIGVVAADRTRSVTRRGVEREPRFHAPRSSSSRPSPRQRRDVQRAGIERRAAARARPRRAESHLLKTSSVGTRSAPTSASTACTAAMWRSRSALDASMTCSSRSASATSSSVARNAATSACGSRSMKPTVSETSSSRLIRQPHLPDERIERHEQRVGRDRVAAGQRVEQRRLAGVGVADQRDGRHRRLVPPLAQLRRGAAAPCSMSFDRTLDARADAPAVGFELGFAGAARADAAAEPRQRRRSTPTSRGSRYFSCASSTCSLPSRVRARRAKMSRISCVRSTTLRSSASSRLRSCAGRQLVVEDDDVDVELRRTLRPATSTLPLPRKVAGSGFGRSCSTRRTTSRAGRCGEPGRARRANVRDRSVAGSR